VVEVLRADIITFIIVSPAGFVDAIFVKEKAVRVIETAISQYKKSVLIVSAFLSFYNLFTHRLLPIIVFALSEYWRDVKAQIVVLATIFIEAIFVEVNPVWIQKATLVEDIKSIAIVFTRR